jgi:glutaredoxin
MEKCPYCDKLKGMLDKEEIKYTDINVDLPENEAEFTSLVKLTKSSSVPTIIVGKNILVPEVAFNTIDEGFALIKNLMD